MSGFIQNRPKPTPIEITPEKKDIVVAYLVDRTSEMGCERFEVRTNAKIKDGINPVEMSLILKCLDSGGYIICKGNLSNREVVVNETLFELNRLGGFKYLEECLFGNLEKLGYELELLKQQVEEPEKRENTSDLLNKISTVSTIISNTVGIFKQITSINPTSK